MVLLRTGALPGDAMAAAAAFHARILPQVLAALANAPASLTLVFAPADHAHRGWRLAAVQGLAREHAPLRVNAVASVDESAVAAAEAYLASAAGVTGQYLPLDGHGAQGALYAP